MKNRGRSFKPKSHFKCNIPKKIRQTEDLIDDKIYSSGSEQTYVSVNDIGNTLVKLLKLVSDVDSQSYEAKLNETSMSDNNGGRIEL